MKLYCASTNRGKLAEFRLAATELAAGRFDIEPLPGLKQIPAAEETGATFEENAIQKALHYGRFTPELLFADDSGLEVDALDGAPGVLSARFAGEGAGDEANNRLLLDRLSGAPTRAARFVCVIALVRDGRLLATFRGTVEGEILQAPRGANGFGYDPLFFHPPFGATFAEATEEQKLHASHRGSAIRQMLKYLAELAPPTPAVLD
jgi:XTP/dITP diphosphohydrolase